MKSDELTIAIPVFERTDFFKEALKSAINQSRPCQILVIDNNSSHDDFKEIINNYNLPHIKFVKNENNLGMLGNWNRCIELCLTKFVTILHDDDLLHPEFVETMEKIDGSWDVIFSKSIVDRDVKHSFYKDIFKYSSKCLTCININSFAFGNFNYAPGTVFSVKSAKDIGGFGTNYGYIMDFHFWVQLTLRGQAYYLNVPLSFYRLSPVQATNVLFKDMVFNTYKLINDIPAFRNTIIINWLSSFRIYSGGMTLFLKSGKTYEDVSTEFSDNTWFIKDHNRFSTIYGFVFLRKTILYLINKMMYLNVKYKLL